MTSKEKFDWIKENISIVDYASSIGFTPVRKGKYYSLKEHDSIIIDTHKKRVLAKFHFRLWKMHRRNGFNNRFRHEIL